MVLSLTSLTLREKYAIQRWENNTDDLAPSGLTELSAGNGGDLVIGQVREITQGLVHEDTAHRHSIVAIVAWPANKEPREVD